MHSQRPVFLNLMQLKFPVMAIVSILHRLSGVFLFILLPWIFAVWQQSLGSEASFSHVLSFELSGWRLFLLWLWLTAAAYHVLAGCRHLVMDLGFAESLTAGRHSAYLILILSALASILLGVWLCLR